MYSTVDEPLQLLKAISLLSCKISFLTVQMLISLNSVVLAWQLRICPTINLAWQSFKNLSVLANK